MIAAATSAPTINLFKAAILQIVSYQTNQGKSKSTTAVVQKVDV